MKKIVINKNFMKNYFHRYMQHIVKPETDAVNDNRTRIYAQNNEFYRNNGYSDNATFLDIYYDLGSDVTNDNYHWGNTWYENADVYARISQLQFVTESFLNMLDKVNLAEYNGTLASIETGYSQTTSTAEVVETGDANNRVNYNRLINSLLSKTISVRDGALDWLFANGIITQAEIDSIKGNCSPMVNFNTANITWSESFEDGNDVYEFYYQNPIELVKYYRQTETNVINEDIYLVFVPYVTRNYDHQELPAYYVNHTHFNNCCNALEYEHYMLDNKDVDTEIYRPYNDFYSEQKNSYISQVTYFAAKVTEVGLGGDIQLDHTDKIDYFDNIRMKFRLPKEIK